RLTRCSGGSSGLLKSARGTWAKSRCCPLSPGGCVATGARRTSWGSWVGWAMAKKFAELRRKMSPERQAQAKARTGKMLAELSPKPTWQDIETGVRSLLDPWAAELVLRRVEQLHLERIWYEAKARVRKARAAEGAAELALTQAQGGNHTR